MKNDPAMRRALLQRLLPTLPPGAALLEEMGLEHGACRVDVATLGEHFHGYELKSEADKLVRLPAQVRAYSAALDRCTLVVSERHLRAALPLVPVWWGVLVATAEGLTEARACSNNPRQEPLAMARLLWREEALVLLERADTARGCRKSNKLTLYKRLIQVLPRDMLRRWVWHALSTRSEWAPRRDVQALRLHDTV